MKSIIKNIDICYGGGGIFLLNKFLAQNRRTGAKSATVAEFEFETETFSQHSIFQILWSCLSVCLLPCMAGCMANACL